jgi:hypothetical protein
VCCSTLYITEKVKLNEEWRTSGDIEKYSEVAPELYNGPVVVYNKPGGLCAERLQIVDDDDWVGYPMYVEIISKLLEILMFISLLFRGNGNRRPNNIDMNTL